MVDLEHLRRHYASLSDEALEEIDPGELVEEARALLEEEIAQRNLTVNRDGDGFETEESEDPGPQVAMGSMSDGEKPDWVEDGAEVFSQMDRGGQEPAEAVLDARAALEEAGIPCYLDIRETPEQTRVDPASREWRLIVPCDRNLYAISVLDRDVFNDEFEGTWRAHLEVLSDEELQEMTPDQAFCGLFDRVERVKRVYQEEVDRRAQGQRGASGA
ncbi:MAG TPA: hypothetical protein VKS01_11275 [Bryobacteraceae bacterium]|nr:hypothetical protein [Bryobacteraceae bacterium]